MSFIFSLLNRPLRRARQDCQLLSENLRKHRAYQEDLLSARDLAEIRAVEAELSEARKGKTPEAIDAAMQRAIKTGNRLFPARPWDGLRENCEVFLVAIVVALSIRAYYLQPFKIPTDSMKPTLYGIQVQLTKDPVPSLPQRIWEFVAYGRMYDHLTIKNGGTIQNVREGHITPWIDYTDLTIGTDTYRVWASASAIKSKVGNQLVQGETKPGEDPQPREFKPGENLTFRVDSGDQVLVNKLVYNFRKPSRGEVFVFKTTNISVIENSLRYQGIEGSQYYIKRCVGVSGDTLQVDAPYLKVGGDVVHSFAFDRVYSLRNGYFGYTNSPDQQFLKTPDESFQLSSRAYWAMGDNSKYSFDSRYWGPVPRENLVGTGLIVYWPFGSRWGIIR